MAAVIPALSHRGGFSVLCSQPSAVRPSLIPEKSEPPLSPLWDLRPCGGQQSHYARPPETLPSDATPSHPPNLARLPQKLWVTAGRHPDQSILHGIVTQGQMPSLNAHVLRRQSANTARHLCGGRNLFFLPKARADRLSPRKLCVCSPVVCLPPGGRMNGRAEE